MLLAGMAAGSPAAPAAAGANSPRSAGPPGIVYAARYYTRQRGQRSFWRLYRIRVDGTGRRALTGGNDHMWPRVSPDGRYVACVRDPWSARSTAVVLSTGDGRIITTWRPARGRTGDTCDYDWTPDARRLCVCVAPEEGAGRVGLAAQTVTISVPSGRVVRGGLRRVTPDGQRLTASTAEEFADVVLVLRDSAGRELSRARIGDMLQGPREDDGLSHVAVLQHIGESRFVIAQNRGHELASALRNWGLYQYSSLRDNGQGVVGSLLA
jgi:hypothetical protein